ncbi:Uncharacterized mitochondrial protein AtMg00310 [Linum grandiflorum]
MSMFKLSDGLCRRLNKQVARFWWGASSTTKRIHLKSWDFLCQPKLQGGLGLRDFSAINQSLLAALCWRLLEDPNSLAFRVLKGRYFLNATFLTAAKGSSPSWAWLGLLYGRELIHAGGIWLIRSGASVPLLSNWISGDYPIPTLLPTTRALPAVVENLIIAGHWNQRLIENLFCPASLNQILSIPLPMLPILDRWTWKHTRTGIYSPASGYRLSFNLRRADNAVMQTPLLVDFELWAKLWALPIPSKLRFFAWKIFLDILPTACALQSRHIDTPTLCQVCLADLESTAHLLTSCSVSRRLALELECPSFSNPDVLPVIIWHRHYLESAQLVAKLIYHWWRLWKARNSVVFDRFQYSVSSLGRQFQLQWWEALASSQRLSPGSLTLQQPTLTAPLQQPWENPSWIMHVDVVVRPESTVPSYGAIGLVVHKGCGSLISATGQVFRHITDPLTLECLAI